MLAVLLFVGCAALSAYMLYWAAEEGAAGWLSKVYFKWQGRLNELELMELGKKPLEIKISVPKLERKKVFEDVVKQVPAKPDGTITGEKEYNAWLDRARMACLERAMEAILVYRSGDELYRDTYCKFTQGQASARAWRDAQHKKEMLERELADIQQWAGELLPGWEAGVLAQASSSLDKLQNRQGRPPQQSQAMQVQPAAEGEPAAPPSAGVAPPPAATSAAAAKRSSALGAAAQKQQQAQSAPPAPAQPALSAEEQAARRRAAADEAARRRAAEDKKRAEDEKRRLEEEEKRSRKLQEELLREAEAEERAKRKKGGGKS